MAGKQKPEISLAETIRRRFRHFDGVGHPEPHPPVPSKRLVSKFGDSPDAVDGIGSGARSP
jgi:hypothetical protein